MSLRRGPGSPGLSLLEVLVSFGLLALVIFSVMVVYSGLLAGTSKADVNREAVATLDSLADLWEREIRETWPAENPPDPVITRTGEFNGFAYRVDDMGRVENPDVPGKYLDLKRVVVEVQFEEFGQDGRRVPRRYSANVHVSK